LAPKSATFNDLERRNGPYFAVFRRIQYIRQLLGPITPKWLKTDLYCLQQKCSSKNLVLTIYHFRNYVSGG